MRTGLIGRMRLLTPHPVTIYRKEDGGYQSGEWAEGKEKPIQTRCNIQPFRNDQKRFLLPDGFRIEHCLVVYDADTKFKTSSVHGQSQADEFEHEGYRYFVYSDQTWKNYGLRMTEHYAALACRTDVGSILNG